MLFPYLSLGHGYRDRGHYLVLKHEDFDSFKHPEEDQQDADILDPGELDHLPEPWLVRNDFRGIADDSMDHERSFSGSAHQPDRVGVTEDSGNISFLIGGNNVGEVVVLGKRTCPIDHGHLKAIDSLVL